ncbi:TonB-dependent receptor [Exilibacterium tricleocarpae]|uniref:TonB-dependent receptor n=1 Tax=Exilibacterium tricleocarpae TaxID=2591008 RepID=A0A545U3G0_9GAMM|nr:TonB-dependent receptor [Exilibacterium tricleocarpae]TQV84012.1 TonB-dependent receptor [Exilibacterium tricleocarpae]
MKMRLNATRLSLAVGLVNAMVAGTVAANEFVLEEIVVTAQKREQSIQDVPISVSAVSGEKIEEAGITDLANLSAYVPNLNISDGGETTNIFMRGLGSGVNFGFEQSVGMYIDGIYYGRDRQYRSPFLDLERVEVLRGPQGTLFGKNTIAGAINITTAKPTRELEGNVSVEYEPEYNTQTITGVLSGPLSDTLAGRLAVKHSETDGFLENTLTGDDEPAEDEFVIRGTLLWEPTDTLEVITKLETAEFDTNGRNTQISEVGSPGLLALYRLADPAFDGELNDKTSKQEEFAEIDSDNFSVTVNYDLGGFTLTSISGYSAYEFTEQQDADYSPLEVLPQAFDQDFEQLSQEIRLTSPIGGDFDYIVGFYYQTTELEHSRLTSGNGGPLGLDVRFGNEAFATPSARYTTFEQDSDSYALFAQGTWHITDTWRLTGGLRYTDEEKTADQGVDFTRFGTTVAIDPVTEAQLHARATLFWNTFGSFEHQFNDVDRNEEDVSPMVNLQWDVTDDVMLYTSLSKGFKGGGFNPNDVAGNNLEFDEEEATAFEFGGKTTLADGAAQLNFALFYTEYDNLQVSSFDGTVFVVTNAAAATTQGLEVDGIWRLTENLTVTGAFAWLDTEFDEFDTAACSVAQNPQNDPTCTQDLAGEDLTFAPELTANLGVQYVRPLTDSLELRTRLDVNYSDEYQIQQDLDPADRVESHTLINASVGLASNEDNWSLALIGQNLTDEDHRTYSFDVPIQLGTHAALITPPRTLAIRATYNF